MSKISEKEMLRRLEGLDEETLVFLSSYARERRKLARASTLVSASIASIAGFALAVTSIFPDFSILVVAGASTTLGGALVWLGLWERRREEQRLIERLLRSSASEAAGLDTQRKRELIEGFLKAEGL